MADKEHPAETKLKQLSKEQLLGVVRGLWEMMYLDVDDEENQVLAPDQEVNGGDLVDWVGHEMERLGLVPKGGDE